MFARYGWLKFKIHKGVYSIPQSGNIVNVLLTKCTNYVGYYQALTMPGLWRHKCNSVTFCLIVDDFGIEYSGELHAHHLRNFHKKH